MNKLVVFLLALIYSCASLYQKSRNESTWDEAREHCSEYGGRLATLKNIYDFRRQSLNSQITIPGLLELGGELWIGAELEQPKWHWQGGETFRDRHAYKNNGCVQHLSGQPVSGIRLDRPSPENCLHECQWRGPVGLKENYCVCPNDLANISSTKSAGICHIYCNTDSNEMCGGLNGISIYEPDNSMISWEENEPNLEYNCVMLRKMDSKVAPKYVTAHCDMQTRYICAFHNDEKCGRSTMCIRWETAQATWDQALRNCRNANGHLAEVGNAHAQFARDLDRLPPGSFWIALRRQRIWKWVNDEQFSLQGWNGEPDVPGRACGVLKYVDGGYHLGHASCDSKKYYLCQYDFMAMRKVTVLTSTEITMSPVSCSTALYSSDKHMSSYATTFATNLNDHAVNEEDSSSTSLNTCWYLILGFVSGMVCVLTFGLIVCLVYRKRRSNQAKHGRLERTSLSHDNRSLNYSSKDDSIQVSVLPFDATYDTVYETESPFRRTQRLIRMGSANSWRHPQVRHARSDSSETPFCEYTWRGMIGGKEEYINTELRQPYVEMSNVVNTHDSDTDLQTAGAVCGTSLLHDSLRSRRAANDKISESLDIIHGIYDLPETEEDQQRRSSNRDSFNDPHFLELQTKTNPDSNEESIYATIKKTFKKIKDDAEKDNGDVKTKVSVHEY